MDKKQIQATVTIPLEEYESLNRIRDGIWDDFKFFMVRRSTDIYIHPYEYLARKEEDFIKDIKEVNDGLIKEANSLKCQLDELRESSQREILRLSDEHKWDVEKRELEWQKELNHRRTLKGIIKSIIGS